MVQTVEDATGLFRINGNPMVDHKDGRMYLSASGLYLDNFGRLRWHMATGAVLFQEGGIHRVGYFAKIMMGS
jgi:hypothetical protein